MKVSELIAELEKLDGEAEVLAEACCDGCGFTVDSISTRGYFEDKTGNLYRGKVPGLKLEPVTIAELGS